MTLHGIVNGFGIKDRAVIEPFGNGLINHTWKVTSTGKEYILQKVNTQVFRHPENIAHNYRLIAAYLKEHHPDYLFVPPIASLSGEDLLLAEDGYYRMFPFVKGSHAKQVVETPDQAFEAARQFGRFTHMLAGMENDALKITIPSFHDLGFRYQQFEKALREGNTQRIQQAQILIGKAVSNACVVKVYEAIKSDPRFKLRPTHHDTKISNVLFDDADKGLCVIDLDTVMPGYFISDVGDMLRTYVSPVSEEEQDFSKIMVRDDFCKAVIEGYASEMKDELTEAEKGKMIFAGQFMTYMQGLRFLTDYLNGDVYYGARYEGHNLVRANNQMILLEQLIAKETGLASGKSCDEQQRPLPDCSL